jgi:hypothetical protein
MIGEKAAEQRAPDEGDRHHPPDDGAWTLPRSMPM